MTSMSNGTAEAAYSAPKQACCLPVLVYISITQILKYTAHGDVLVPVRLYVLCIVSTDQSVFTESRGQQYLLSHAQFLVTIRHDDA